MLTKIKQDNMPDNEYGEQKTYKLKTKDKEVKVNLEKPKQTKYGNTLPEMDFATKQMQVDPLTGMPLTTPGPQGEPPARSSDLYVAEDPGYPQGSMVNAMAANPMMGGLTQYGLKQKEEFDPAKADRNNDGNDRDWETRIFSYI